MSLRKKSSIPSDLSVGKLLTALLTYKGQALAVNCVKCLLFPLISPKTLLYLFRFVALFVDQIIPSRHIRNVFGCELKPSIL